VFLLIVSTFSFAAWGYLLLFRGGYWRTDQRLTPAPELAAWPSVAVIIPARNEAASISAVIASHMASDYPGAFSVFLVDDRSSDDTAALAIAAAEGAKHALAVTIAPPLAPGWSGKLAAVKSGVAEAAAMTPAADYLLLTDADIVHARSTLRRLIAKAEHEGIALTSLMARLDARGFWGGLLIPAFVYFFQKLYPFALVNNRASNVAAAAGGCMLVRRDIFEAAGGVNAIKGALIDDVALAKNIKSTKGGQNIWLGLATDEVISLRDNRSLASIWTMVARTAFTQLNHSWLLLAGTSFAMALIYLAPPAIALTSPWHASGAAAAIAGGAWIIMAATYFPTVRAYAQQGWKAAFLPAAAAFYAAMTVSSGLRHLFGRGASWKGRHY